MLANCSQTTRFHAKDNDLQEENYYKICEFNEQYSHARFTLSEPWIVKHLREKDQEVA